MNRATGSYAIYYWIDVLGALLVPQLFWIRRCRATAWIAPLIGMVISIPPVLQAMAVFPIACSSALGTGSTSIRLVLESF